MAIPPRGFVAFKREKVIAEVPPASSEEWAAGPWPVLKNMRQLRQSLADIESSGHPKIPGPVTTRPDGQVVAQVFPQTAYDRIFFMGIKGGIWMEPGVTAEELPKTQAA